MVRLIAQLVGGLALVWGSSACTRDRSLDFAAGKPRKVDAAQPNPSPVIAQFALAAGSVARFSVGAGLGKVQGSIPVLRSTVEIDFADFSESSARVTFSLQDLTLEPAKKPHLPDFPETASMARDWLQLAPPFAGQFYPEVEFVLERIGSRKGRLRVPPHPSTRTALSGKTRRVRGFATGSLSLHGVRRTYTLPVSVTFRYGETGALPASAVFESRGSTTVDLTDHRLPPWGGHGTGAKPQSGKLSGIRAPVVRVNFHWQAHRTEPAMAPRNGFRQ